MKVMWQITVVCPDQEIPVILITVLTGSPYCPIVFRADVGSVESPLQAARFPARSVRVSTVVDRPRRLFATEDEA
jgi:hypothetical protein